MQEFTGKVAVVTGAASGIGRALAERCAREGMKVVLADVEEPALARAAAEMQASGATVLAVPTDVSKLADVENLARRTVETFGAVHLLFNNAGVGTGGSRDAAIWRDRAGRADGRIQVGRRREPGAPHGGDIRCRPPAVQ